jgi:hypothetical protein
MRPLIHSVLVLLTCSVWISDGLAQSSATATGTIQGVVLENDGKPLAGAEVYALPEENMLKPIRARADDKGKFTISDVPAGTVYLEAAKEDQGHPYSLFSFFIMPGQKEPNQIKVKAGEVTKGALIRMGAKAASLTIMLTDESNRPVPNAAFVFVRPDIPGGYRRGAGEKTTLQVPPVPFHFSVMAPGYETWNSDEIHLKSGESQTVSAVLHKRAEH